MHVCVFSRAWLRLHVFDSSSDRLIGLSACVVIEQRNNLGFDFTTLNSPFPSCTQPSFQTEAKCKTIHMDMSFLLHANTTYIHMNSFALGLGLKRRLRATRLLKTTLSINICSVLLIYVFCCFLL